MSVSRHFQVASGQGQTVKKSFGFHRSLEIPIGFGTDGSKTVRIKSCRSTSVRKNIAASPGLMAVMDCLRILHSKLAWQVGTADGPAPLVKAEEGLFYGLTLVVFYVWISARG